MALPAAAIALPAAAVADALVRLGLPVRLAPIAMRRAFPGAPIAGPAVPCRHFGSVDVFLEAYESAPAGGPRHRQRGPDRRGVHRRSDRR